MDTLASVAGAVNLRGPTKAEADAVARLIGYPPMNAPKARRSRYEDIDLHSRKATAWPSQLPKLTGEEAIQAAKRLWRNAVGLAWPGTWKAGRGNHRTYPRGSVFLVNPGQGWDGMVHDLSHQAYKSLTQNRRTNYPIFWRGEWRTTRGPTIAVNKMTFPICSDAKMLNYEHVRTRTAGGNRIHHSDAHAELERAMIVMVVKSGWLDGKLRPAAKPKREKLRPIRFSLS